MHTRKTRNVSLTGPCILLSYIVVGKGAALTSPENLISMQNGRAHPTPTAFQKDPGDLYTY